MLRHFLPGTCAIAVLLTACGRGAHDRSSPISPPTPEPVSQAGPAATPERKPADAPPAARRQPEARRAPGQTRGVVPLARTCAVGDPITVGSSEERRVTSRVALDARGGMVAFTHDASQVSVRRLDPDGAPLPGETQVELTNARDLWGLFRLPHHYLIVSHGVCPDTRRLDKCLALRALGDDGRPEGEEFVQRTREWMLNPHRAVSGDSLVLLRGHQYLSPALERYRVGADGTVTREALAEVSPTPEGEEPPATFGLAVDGDRWAALLRIYDERHARPRLRLYATGAEPRDLPLRTSEEQRGLDLTFVEGGLRLITGVLGSRGRASVTLLDARGEVTEDRRLVRSDEVLEPNTVRAELTIHHRRLRLTRRDVVERPIGETTDIGPGDAGDVAGSGDPYVVASVLSSRREPSQVQLRIVSCGAPRGDGPGASE